MIEKQMVDLASTVQGGKTVEFGKSSINERY